MKTRPTKRVKLTQKAKEEDKDKQKDEGAKRLIILKPILRESTLQTASLTMIFNADPVYESVPNLSSPFLFLFVIPTEGRNLLTAPLLPQHPLY